MYLKVLGVLCVLCVFGVSSYKILVVFPAISKSHVILGNGYVKHLLDAGHEVTYITAEKMKTPHKNLTQVDVSSNFKIIPEDMMDLKNIMKNEAISNVIVMLYFTYSMSKAALQHENVVAFINDDTQQFDVVIAEWMFSDLNVGFASLYNCPFILAGSLDPHWSILRLVDEATNPAYTADMMSSTIPPFTFGQRLTELYNQIKVTLVSKALTPFENAVYNEVFRQPTARRGRTLAPLADARHNVSMILGNSNKPLSSAIRLPANYKEVGGYHIDAHNTPLPQNIQKVMDEAKNGVIYFSLGSNVKSKDMPEQMKRDLLKMFGELKQVVLWKFEEELPGLPKNVHILKWAPQPSILRHPNCILFITHGGLLSITESIYFGVPIIGLPAFGDQFMNINKAVAKGFALTTKLSVDMAQPLKETIQEITTNKKYRETTKRLSSIYHDRLVSPGAELVHWVEHVVRTGGALHLRSPALMVPWYQKIYLDLIALILVIVYFLLKSYKCIKCYLCKKQTKKTKTS